MSTNNFIEQIKFRQSQYETIAKNLIEAQNMCLEKGEGGPFTAAVINSETGEVVAYANNKVFAEKDPTAHAEVVAIREACKKLGVSNLKGYYLISSSEPCPMCYGAIHWARLDGHFFIANKELTVVFDDGSLMKDMGKLYSDKDTYNTYIKEHLVGTAEEEEAIYNGIKKYTEEGVMY